MKKTAKQLQFEAQSHIDRAEKMQEKFDAFDHELEALSRQPNVKRFLKLQEQSRELLVDIKLAHEFAYNNLRSALELETEEP